MTSRGDTPGGVPCTCRGPADKPGGWKRASPRSIRVVIVHESARDGATSGRWRMSDPKIEGACSGSIDDLGRGIDQRQKTYPSPIPRHCAILTVRMHAMASPAPTWFAGRPVACLVVLLAPRLRWAITFGHRSHVCFPHLFACLHFHTALHLDASDRSLIGCL